jgi:hypothetical protein
MSISREKEQIGEETEFNIGVPGIGGRKKRIYKVTEHYCPEGYYWVRGQQTIRGYRIGHCAKKPKKRFGLF